MSKKIWVSGWGMVDMNQEHVDRFHKYCGKGGQNDKDLFILSDDRCMGIKKDITEKDAIFFGTLKLKYRPKTKILKVGNMYVDSRKVLTAMRVLRRRKYLSLGLLKMGNGTIFFLQEGNNNVCIAPMISEGLANEPSDSIFNMVEPSSGLLMEWICYSRVFGEKKQ